MDLMILKLFQSGIKILDMRQGNLKKFYMCQGGPNTLKASDWSPKYSEDSVYEVSQFFVDHRVIPQCSTDVRVVPEYP